MTELYDALATLDVGRRVQRRLLAGVARYTLATLDVIMTEQRRHAAEVGGVSTSSTLRREDGAEEVLGANQCKTTLVYKGRVQYSRSEFDGARERGESACPACVREGSRAVNSDGTKAIL